LTNPEFSVVVPAYNATRTIAATIASVLGQTAADLELIVVDDGSTDATPELVEQTAAGDQRLRLIRQENQGTAGARNTGLEAARGRFVSLLDNDDAWLPQYLEVIRQAFAASPAAGIAFSDAWIFDEGSGLVHHRTSLEYFPPGYLPSQMAPIDADRFLALLLEVNFITASTATLRKEAIDRVGGFDPSIRGVDDYDLWLRVGAAGYGAIQAAGRPAILCDRDDSQSKDLLMMYRSMYDVLTRFSAEHEVEPRSRAALDRRLRAERRIIGALAGERNPAAVAERLRRRLAGLRRRLRSRAEMGPAPAEVASVLGRRGDRP
jgi:glycosyltransferase involved in cell wall biosynthesis